MVTKLLCLVFAVMTLLAVAFSFNGCGAGCLGAADCGSCEPPSCIFPGVTCVPGESSCLDNAVLTCAPSGRVSDSTKKDCAPGVCTEVGNGRIDCFIYGPRDAAADRGD